MSGHESSLEQHRYIVEAHHSGKRLDQISAEAFSDYSRARLQSWIKNGQLKVDGEQRKPRDKLFGGEFIELSIEPELDDRWEAEPLELNVIDEDEDIIVINKPAGLVVHPGAGVPNGTLLNGLLHAYPELQTLPRAGIVHRLDKDTSGLMVVARSLKAHTSLVKQLQDRSLGREYEAIVMGEMTGGGTVDKPIGRHPSQRVKMAVLESSSTAKEAITHYRLIKRYQRYTHVACQLETGRTHQIRVHMAHINHPLVGDPVYLGRQRWLAGTPKELKQALIDFPRQALHAKKLSLIHPSLEEECVWESDLPQDMQNLLIALDKDQRNGEDYG
jgi:23S rRNA pseudouridine1911/1915/1917 synthase